MDVDKVIAALNSKLRREILKIISEQPMTVIQVLEKLKKREVQVKYRETVYRALEKLCDAELVEKYYEKEKGLCYRLSLTQITIEITKEFLNIVK